MGHKSYYETLGYIDPEILFVILSQFLDREKSLLVLHALIPSGIMRNWVYDDMTLEKCEACLYYYKKSKLIEIYNNISNSLIKNKPRAPPFDSDIIIFCKRFKYYFFKWFYIISIVNFGKKIFFN
jgi:hypothetical protein